MEHRRCGSYAPKRGGVEEKPATGVPAQEASRETERASEWGGRAGARAPMLHAEEPESREGKKGGSVHGASGVRTHERTRRSSYRAFFSEAARRHAHMAYCAHPVR